MMKCQVCGKTGQTEGEACPYCGAVVHSVLGKGQPLPTDVAREFEEANRKREAGRAERRKVQLKRYALVGGLAFFAFGIVMFVTQLFLSLFAAARGMASGWWLVKCLLVSLVLIPVYAAALGAPMGLLVGKWRLGVLSSGLLGAVVFLAFYFVLGLRLVFGPAQTLFMAILVPFFGFVFGGVVSIGVGLEGER